MSRISTSRKLTPKAVGCHKLHADETGGSKAERPGLERALADVWPGDSLVGW